MSAGSSATSSTRPPSPPRVRVEPHGPGRLLVLITRREQRAFQLSHAEAAWLSGALARYLAELPEADAAALVAALAAELADTFGAERLAALCGSLPPVAEAPVREAAPGRARPRGALRAVPAARHGPAPEARP